MGTHQCASVLSNKRKDKDHFFMKKAFIIFLLLQVINIHLCEEDNELDADLTDLEEADVDADVEDREDIPLPMWCANKRFNMCKKKLWKMMRKARDMCGENVKCIARKMGGRIGKCKPCLCRAVYTFGPRVFSNKITIELLLELDCYN